MKNQPSQGKDKNAGVYATPLEFLKAVNKLWPISWDLAATEENSVLRRLEKPYNFHYSIEEDSLKQSWQIQGWCWLNPPFSDIEPWAKKCAEETTKGARILLLVPQGSQNWNLLYCRPFAMELRLTPRMKFVGCKDLYPKDLSLFVFGSGLVGSGFWRWKK